MAGKRERPLRVMRGVRSAALAAALIAAVGQTGSGAQPSRQSGDRVRDAFTPTGGVCHGACGSACRTSACSMTVGYECASPDRLRRVRTYVCGTHQGCRDHDECLNRCRQRQPGGTDCETTCHTQAVEQYGLETAVAWSLGQGPLDAAPITFEYTRDAPNAPEPLFACPEGTRLSCGATAGRCVTAAGADVTPVFDAYAGNGAGMQISGFRSGRVCRDGGNAQRVCEQAVDIAVTGERAWYGFQFDYTNADPSAPLLCSVSGAEDDFLGGLIGGFLASAPTDDRTELGQLFGKLQGELQRGASMTDILSGIRVTPAGKSPMPDAAPGTTPGVPASTPIPAARGHLVVPMFERRDGAAPGSTLVRNVRCTHDGAPVLETSFRLRFPGR